MKVSYYKNMLLILMCLCLFGCSKPEALVKAPTEPVLTTAPVEGESFSIPDINLDMLWCKPGTFMMGSPEDEEDRYDDETQHEVTLTQGFYLGKYEVTQEQWEKVMGTDPSLFEGATLPVEKVSWEDAMKFCEKLTQMEKAAGRLPEGWAYTLPTEAQWEYTCRAGTTTAYSFGDEITPTPANYDEKVGKTTSVGTYPANVWGFHDLYGNVWEWCSDRYGKYPSGSESDPVGPSVGALRVGRGGGWGNFDSRFLRSAYRAAGATGGERSRVCFLQTYGNLQRSAGISRSFLSAMKVPNGTNAARKRTRLNLNFQRWASFAWSRHRQYRIKRMPCAIPQCRT
jgi:formylglycine-generating enzyme required for sulfatase activity